MEDLLREKAGQELEPREERIALLKNVG